jgi:hypothetical protein
MVHAGGRSQGPYGRFEMLLCVHSMPFKYPHKGLIFSWAEFYRTQFLNFVGQISKSVFHPVYFKHVYDFMDVTGFTVFILQ